MKKNTGFTLVELLVVMAILGLLAVIGLGSFRSSQIKARDAQRKHGLGQLQRGLEARYNDTGEYPLTGDLPSGGNEWRDAAGTLYMKSIPADPRGPDYFYESDGASYKILAHLENENDRDIETCGAVTDSPCVTGDCNYGVSSANVNTCD